ncbi:MAG TPA: dNTP triphosphohydrolase [Oligoflexus sp.]|uniref:deoxyguanosinetriphosphate triphosphohydrolase family protein n=1 Tax=Oligoflexus sp. TaxID=1971216 RepID=UPI002D804ADA|nr:dNTP triphosphohydrolase [Oligoflexus sp.]HET9238145.1 dNTP triphosphohydrolase [Oligoflexus sp.]
MTIKWMSEKRVTFKGIEASQTGLIDRSTFLRDYGSIIYRSQFRRQSFKTQVFLNPELDFPRTRLTHAIEVEQVGRQLARYFAGKIPERFSNVPDGFARDFEDLVAAASLAHDIGQAPFGHKGETVLNELMKDRVKGQETNHFEANKQNVRILLGSIARQPFGVTCALVDAVMKYKASSFESEAKKYPGHYCHEKGIVTQIFEENNTLRLRHPACYIMEAADDISYISGDIQDALKLGLITEGAAENILTNIQRLNPDFSFVSQTWAAILRECQSENDYAKVLTYVLRSLVKSCRTNLEGFIQSVSKGTDINELPALMDRYFSEKKCDLNILYANHSENLKETKKRIYKDHILMDSEIARNEILAEKVIRDLWNAASESLLKKDFEKQGLFKLMPVHVQNHIKAAHQNQDYESQKYQIVADYISGMTDRYAISIWRKIFDPSTLKFT